MSNNKKFTKEEFAALLNGREYGDEITNGECLLAKESGLVVVFGYSDDNIEFRGCINEELGCYNGGDFLVIGDKAFQTDHDCDCAFCNFKEMRTKGEMVTAVWGEGGYSWLYATTIPHATFDIMEDGEKFCRGIVFELKEVAGS